MEYFTVAKVAEILKISPNTVRKYIRQGRLKAIKIGREYRISEKRFKEFLKETETNDPGVAGTNL